MSYGIKGAVTGIPICIIGEEFRSFYYKRDDSLRLFPHLSVGPFMQKVQDCIYRSKSTKEKGSECILCKYYSQCEGLQQRYIQRYGFDDLKPIV